MITPEVLKVEEWQYPPWNRAGEWVVVYVRIEAPERTVTLVEPDPVPDHVTDAPGDSPRPGP